MLLCSQQLYGLGLRELCSKFSSLIYSEFPPKLFHYAYYYSQNLLIILIILNLTVIFTTFLHFCNQKLQQILQQLNILSIKTVISIRIAVIVVKYSVTSVYCYELLRADCSIGVNDCSIRVSRSNYFYANYASQLHQNSGIILDSFTLSLFPKLFKHNSRIPITDSCTILQLPL